jgi:hypothetical protein
LQQLTNYLRNPLQQEEWRSEGGYHRYVFPNEHTVYFLKMLLKREGCYQGVQELIAKEQGKEAKSKVDLQALFTELKEDGSK